MGFSQFQALYIIMTFITTLQGLGYFSLEEDKFLDHVYLAKNQDLNLKIFVYFTTPYYYKYIKGQ